MQDLVYHENGDETDHDLTIIKEEFNNLLIDINQGIWKIISKKAELSLASLPYPRVFATDG